jgi:rhomboid protease GluP
VNELAEPQQRQVSYSLPLSRPIFTWILLATIVLVFIAETLAGGSTDIQVLVSMGAKVTPLIAAGEYWRLFTCMFLHIGLVHLLFNGYALLAIGTEVERLFGPGRFLIIYLLSGLLGSLASYAFSVNLAAGASGAIFGLVGALAAFFILHRERLGTWGRMRLVNTAFLIAINLFLGLTQPGIDNLAHIGGLLGGLGLGWALAPRYKVAPVPLLRTGPIRLQVIDENRLRRYWPALALAVGILVGGTALTTLAQRDSPRSHLFRAQQAIEREAWEEAAAEFEQALAKDPSVADVSTYFYLGLAYNYLEQPERAAQAYESALELDPGHTPSLWNLAITNLDLGRYAQARSQFETYMELEPSGGVQAKPYLDELSRLGY